jgi:hypothetical protein
MEQMYIKNMSGSPFKIPFKPNTPYDVQALVKGVIDAGKRKFIPAEVAIWIDRDRLENFARHREIQISIKQEVLMVTTMPNLVNHRSKPVNADKVRVTKEMENEKGGN